MTSLETGWSDPGWRALCDAVGDLAGAAGVRVWAAENDATQGVQVKACGTGALAAESARVPEAIIDLSVAAFEARSRAFHGEAAEVSGRPGHALVAWPLSARHLLVMTADAPATLATCAQAATRLAERLANWSRTETAMAALAEGHLITDRSLTVRVATPRAATLLGAAGPAELEGRRLHELDRHWPETMPEPGEIIRARLTERHVSWIAHTLAAAARVAIGDPEAAVVVRLRGDATFKDSHGQQIHLLSALRHDVRSPLTAVRGLIAVLIDEPDIPRQERIGLLELLRQEAERTVTWVEDYLIMLRLRLDPSPHGAMRCDLGPWIAGLEAYFGAHCVERKIQLDLGALASRPSSGLASRAMSGAAPGPHALSGCAVEAEPLLLDAFGKNLVGHALRLADAGAQVRLAIDEATGALTLTASGPGLFGRAHEHPFTTLARSTASGKRTPGVGLGLFLVKRIADVHAWPISLGTLGTIGNVGAVGSPSAPGVLDPRAKDSSAAQGGNPPDAGLRVTIGWPLLRIG